MKMMLSISIILFTILISGVFIYCQSDSLVKDIKTIDGYVASVDIQNSNIAVKASEVMTFSVPSSAAITNADGFSIQLSDVKIGSYATIGYYDEQSGKHVLIGMEIEYKN